MSNICPQECEANFNRVYTDVIYLLSEARGSPSSRKTEETKSTINCREYNVRASLLQSPIPLSGFNYQPVFLEPEEAKCLHNPLISKPWVVKLYLVGM